MFRRQRLLFVSPSSVSTTTNKSTNNNRISTNSHNNNTTIKENEWQLIDTASKSIGQIFRSQFQRRKLTNKNSTEDLRAKIHRATAFYYGNFIRDQIPVPFLARYRKDLTRGLSEAELYRILYAFDDAKKLVEKRQEVLRAIPEDTLTPLLRTQVTNASSLSELDQMLSLAQSKSSLAELIERKEEELAQQKKKQENKQVEAKLMKELEEVRREYFGNNDDQEGNDNDESGEEDESSRSLVLSEQQKKQQKQKQENQKQKGGSSSSSSSEDQTIFLKRNKNLEENLNDLAEKMLGIPLFRPINNNNNGENNNKFHVTYEKEPEKCAATIGSLLNSESRFQNFVEISASYLVRNNPEFIQTFLELGDRLTIFTISRNPAMAPVGAFSKNYRNNNNDQQQSHHHNQKKNNNNNNRKQHQQYGISVFEAVEFEKKVANKFRDVFPALTLDKKEPGRNFSKMYSTKMHKTITALDTNFIASLLVAEKDKVVTVKLHLPFWVMRDFLDTIFQIFFPKAAAEYARNDLQKMIYDLENEAANNNNNNQKDGGKKKKLRKAEMASIVSVNLKRLIANNFRHLVKSEKKVETMEQFSTLIQHIALRVWLIVERLATDGARAEAVTNAREDLIEQYKTQMMMMLLQKPALAGTNDRSLMTMNMFYGSNDQPIANCAIVDRNGNPQKTFTFTFPRLGGTDKKLIEKTNKNRKTLVMEVIKLLRDYGVKKIAFITQDNALSQRHFLFFDLLLELYNSSIKKDLLYRDVYDDDHNNNNNNNNNNGVENNSNNNNNDELLHIAACRLMGSRAYIDSEQGREDLSKTVEKSYYAAVHFARRLINPIGELSKVPPENLFGQTANKAEVPPEKIAQAVREEMSSVIVNCGFVDINTSPHVILLMVPGMTEDAVKKIIRYRKLVGAIKSRDDLKKVIENDRVWTRVCGFLRCSLSLEPFDRTTLHPAWYSTARLICKELGVNPASIIVADKKKEQNLHQASALLLTAQNKLSDSVRSAIAANELARARASSSSGGSSEQAKEEQQKRIAFAQECRDAIKKKFPTQQELADFKTRMAEENKDSLKTAAVVDTIIEELCLPQIDLRDHFTRGGIFRPKILSWDDVKVGDVHEGFVLAVSKTKVFVDIGATHEVICSKTGNQNQFDTTNNNTSSSEDNNDNNNTTTTEDDDDNDLKINGAKYAVPYTRVFVTITKKDPDRRSEEEPGGFWASIRGTIDMTDERNMLRSNFASSSSAASVWDAFVMQKKSSDHHHHQKRLGHLHQQMTNWESQKLLLGLREYHHDSHSESSEYIAAPVFVNPSRKQEETQKKNKKKKNKNK